jgi:adenosylcobinamide kinase/adenosylcobinamide-phosphate guanylyltransferase
MHRRFHSHLDAERIPEERMRMVLIGGGSRSGKSGAALRMLRAAGPRRAFIATAQAFDDEMTDRIAHHRAERDPDVVTFEEPFEVAARIRSEEARFDAILVDCLTLWLSNLMLADRSSIAEKCRELVQSASSASARVILVTNEVGCGIVPENALARRFRDEAGRLNQLAAEHAQEVHWMIFGIGMRIK